MNTKYYVEIGTCVAEIFKDVPVVLNYMGKSPGKNYVICLCAYDKAMVTYDDYELLLYLADKAKISADHIYLFAGNRFDEKLDSLYPPGRFTPRNGSVFPLLRREPMLSGITLMW